jgi:hypothetical protein
LNWKIVLIKGKKIKRMRIKLKKIKQQKIWLKDEIEIKKNFNKSAKEKLETLKIEDWNEKSNIWEITNEKLNWKE